MLVKVEFVYIWEGLPGSWKGLRNIKELGGGIRCTFESLKASWQALEGRS